MGDISQVTIRVGHPTEANCLGEPVREWSSRWIRPWSIFCGKSFVFSVAVDPWQNGQTHELSQP